MLQPEKRGIEAAETAAIHRMGEISILGAVAVGLSTKLTQAFQFMLRWALIDDSKAEVVLNSDFIPTQAQPQLLTAMMQAWQQGAISYDTFWKFMQDGELVDPSRMSDEEQAIIQDEDAADKQRQLDMAKQFPELAPPQLGGPVPPGTPGGPGQPPPKPPGGQGQPPQLAAA
jgi:hypothetical protein